MTDNPDWMRPVDLEILTDLERIQPEYIPLVANRIGIHLSYAEHRCTLLIEHGLIVSVTGEEIYQVTDHGRTVLTAARERELTAATGEKSDENDRAASM